MNELNARVILAKSDDNMLDSLLRDYMPFVQSVLAKQGFANVAYDDQLSVALLVFVNCVRQFDETKGNFLAYLAAAIANRLRDEGQKQARTQQALVSIDDPLNEPAALEAGNRIAVQAYSLEEERKLVAEEIDSLSQALGEYGIDLFELEKVAPRQKRSRKQCAALAAAIVQNDSMRESLVRTRRLPMKRLAEASGVSLKTLDKYRRYIMALVVIFLGDFPSIRAFIPDEEEGTP